MDGYLATILPWAAAFAPRNWAFCNGQTLQISQNAALFSLLGTTYGGDGRATFALPNLQSRVMVGKGQIPGLQPYTLGQAGGADAYRLTATQIPQHTHNNTVSGSASNVTVSVAIPAVSSSPADAFKPGTSALLGKNTANQIYSSAAADTNLEPFNATGTVTPLVSISNAVAGGNDLIDNRQPYLAVNFIICVTGMFPVRN